MPSINKQCCPTCGRSINSREIAIFSSLINALFVIWKHCEKKGVYYFTRKEAKKIFQGNENVTARFGDLILFGGILYHPDNQKGSYGFNIERAKSFFMGELDIPTKALKNPITKEYVFSDYRKINEIRNLKSFLNDNNEYIVRYKNERVKDTLF